MSTPTSTIEFVDLVRRSGIIPAKQFNQFLEAINDPPQSPSRLAAVLIRRGLLTHFQARLLLAGKFRGFRVGAYVIREQLGQGGMGAVYLAEHETLRRKVALKVLAKADVAGPAGVERFLREARATAALDHPNIVRLYDVGRQGPMHYLVMEYVEGQTLEQILAARGPIPCGRAVEYVAQAAAGLQHAYEKGFVHRDVKPANLMLARDGTVKILDMGLARSFGTDERLTDRLDEGVILGTADFISPEQAINDPDVDIRADIYSLGASFFTLVTGRPPFEGNTTQKLLQHQMRPAPFLCDVDPTFQPQLAEVVAVMMAKRPEDRLQTPAEVIAALSPWVPSSAQLVAGLSRTDLGIVGMGSAAGSEVTLSELMATRTRRMTGRHPALPSSQTRLTALVIAGAVVVGLLLIALIYGISLALSQSLK
jgi:serine/threonine protein kinase